jgi:hypothetical protein
MRGKHIDLESPRGYYLDYSKWSDPRRDVDDAGLPLARSNDGALVESPRRVARYALGNLEIYLEGGSSGRRERFERACRWLVGSQESVPGSFASWSVPDPPRALRRELGHGWFGGAVHAECVSALVRAASLVRLDGADEAVRVAFPGFCTTVEDGGFLREIGDTGDEAGLATLAFIEEHPMPRRPSLALGGHLRALWAIFDVARAMSEEGAPDLFERCVRGLVFSLDRYDTGYWSRHDLDETWSGERLADQETHREHILGLETVHEMSGTKALRDTARRWRGYEARLRGRFTASARRLAFGLRNPLVR